MRQTLSSALTSRDLLGQAKTPDFFLFFPGFVALFYAHYLSCVVYRFNFVAPALQALTLNQLTIAPSYLMATVMAQSTDVPPTAPNPNAEPGEEWKVSLRKEIEQSLLPMLSEARQALEQKLEEAPVGAETRDRLAKEHSDTLKNIRRIAEDLFRDQIEQEHEAIWHHHRAELRIPSR